MRLMAGVTYCLLLCTVLLVLPANTTAQSDQEIIQRIAELEQWILDNPGVFDWHVHNELRHLYSIKNPPDLRKSMEHSNVILQHSVMDGYILNILSGWQIGVDTPAARANLLTNAQVFPDLRFIAAACFLKIGDLYTEEGNLEEATSFYLRVAEDNSPDMAQYRMFAEERLSQQGQPPAAPSNVQVEEITHEGRPSTKVSWTDNADNELGYVVVDQNRPQRYEADSVPGIGATGSRILPFVSSFCVYAYNDYGISDAVCQGELKLPWTSGEEWYYTGGPHADVTSIRSGVDFAPETQPIQCPSFSADIQSSRWVVAAASGEVVRSGDSIVEIEHTGGLRTGYMHLADIQVQVGESVERGDQLGHPSCAIPEGGDTTGVHLHFYFMQDGEHIPADGQVLSGWTIHAAEEDYQGTMTKPNEDTRTANGGRCAPNRSDLGGCDVSNIRNDLISGD